MELTKTLQKKLESFKKRLELNTVFNEQEKLQAIDDYEQELRAIMPKRGRKPMNLSKTYGVEYMPELKDTFKTILWISNHLSPKASRIWTMMLCKRYQVRFIKLSNARYFDIHDFQEKTGRKLHE